MNKENNILLALLIILVFGLTGYIVYNEMDKQISTPEQGKIYREVNYNKNQDSKSIYNQIITYQMPEQMVFAGEPVPLYEPDVRERLDREIHINLYWHSSTIFLIKRANRWLPQIGKILEENQIPEDFKYLPLIESGLMNVVSFRQAVGFWQLREATAKELGLEVDNEVDERYDPIKSTEAAVKYLKKAYERFGNWTNVAASYNLGMYGLDNRLEDQQVDSYYDLLLNEETARYMFRILAIKEIMNNLEKYGYDIPPSHLYQIEPVREVVVDYDIKNLVDFAFEQNINYKLLKRFNPWLRRSTLVHRHPGKKYKILIPVRDQQNGQKAFQRKKEQTASIEDVQLLSEDSIGLP
ncbi:MAG: lytic transglycosylase domain-containing protein [Candidatus Cyclobacteriaceae bacterium M3_2C_046]